MRMSVPYLLEEYASIAILTKCFERLIHAPLTSSSGNETTPYYQQPANQKGETHHPQTLIGQLRNQFYSVKMIRLLHLVSEAGINN